MLLTLGYPSAKNSHLGVYNVMYGPVRMSCRAEELEEADPGEGGDKFSREYTGA